MANKIKIAPYDGVILEVSNFYSKSDCEEVRKKVIEQLQKDGVAILPIGITAKTVKQFKCVMHDGDTMLI